eukprot:tig00000802_g4294.t1
MPAQSSSGPRAGRQSRSNSSVTGATATLVAAPTASEIEEFGSYIGVDPEREKHLLWICVASYYAPLPPGWEEHVDEGGEGFYYNVATDTSQREHPLDEYFRSLYRRERDFYASGRSDDPSDPTEVLVEAPVGGSTIVRRTCTPDEVRRIARSWGVDTAAEVQLLRIARAAADDLPPGWQHVVDAGGVAGYRHRRTGVVMRQHPRLVEYFRAIEAARAGGALRADLAPETYACCVLNPADPSKVDEMWLHFRDAEGAQYYFDFVSGGRSSQDPRNRFTVPAPLLPPPPPSSRPTPPPPAVAKAAIGSALGPVGPSLEAQVEARREEARRNAEAVVAERQRVATEHLKEERERLESIESLSEKERQALAAIEAKLEGGLAALEVELAAGVERRKLELEQQLRRHEAEVDASIARIRDEFASRLSKQVFEFECLLAGITNGPGSAVAFGPGTGPPPTLPPPPDLSSIKL